MTKRVAELQQKLKDMDADVGVYSRNVGNYSSAFDGLQGAVDNAAKKLPQLASGFAGFAAAMVEDIPKIIAQLQAMTAAEEGVAVGNETMAATGELAGMANTTVGATATTAAAGETAMGVAAEGAAVGVSTLVKACTSWNVILLAIITVLQIFADDIQEWIEGLAEGVKGVGKLNDALSGLSDYIEQNGLGVGETILKYREMQETWNALADDMEKKKKYIEDNQGAFEELGVAVASITEADSLFIENTNAYIEALRARAQASAASKLASEEYEKAIIASLKTEQEQAKLAGIPEEKLQSWVDYSGGVHDSWVVNQDYIDQKAIYQAAIEEEKAALDRANSYFDIAQQFEAESMALLKGAGLKGTATTTPPASPPTTPTTSTTSAKPMAKDDLIALTGGAIDASAEREALKVTLDARIRMTTANAEEREKIEKELADRLNEIEKARLDLTIVNLEAMLESEMLTNEQRLNIEAELIQAKIDLADMEVEKRKEADAEKLKSEEERAKKEKAVKDKEAKEEAEREKQMQSVKANMLNMTTSLIRQSAELFEEDSKERKALNAAAIVMDTYKAAMAAWTAAQGLPPGIGQAVGAANVAASVAMGAMQLANLFKVAPDGSNAEGALSSAQSAPNVASSMPASYTRSLQGDNELTEMNKDTRVYVVESDITNAQKSARVRVESATF